MNHTMSHSLFILIALLLAGSAEAKPSRVDNPLLGYTHLLPSPFTAPGGRMVIGTDLTVILVHNGSTR